MALIVLAVIAGLALFQFRKSRQRLKADLVYDAALHFTVGTCFTVLGLFFGLGVLLA
jgi:hypothetical protein